MQKVGWFYQRFGKPGLTFKGNLCRSLGRARFKMAEDITDSRGLQKRNLCKNLGDFVCVLDKSS